MWTRSSGGCSGRRRFRDTTEAGEQWVFQGTKRARPKPVIPTRAVPRSSSKPVPSLALSGLMNWALTFVRVTVFGAAPTLSTSPGHPLSRAQASACAGRLQIRDRPKVISSDAFPAGPGASPGSRPGFRPGKTERFWETSLAPQKKAPAGSAGARHAEWACEIVGRGWGQR